MPNFESTDRALIDLRDERDHLSIQISLLAENRLTAPDELFRLRRQLEALERRIVVHTRSSDASSGDAVKRTSANDGGRTEE